MLTISQTLMFIVEIVHSLIAGALLGALVESVTKVTPMHLVIFLYSMVVSSLAAVMIQRKVPRGSVMAFVASLPAVITITSLFRLVYTTLLRVSRTLGGSLGICFPGYAY